MGNLDEPRPLKLIDARTFVSHVEARSYVPAS
jgi:hypothetical protein